MNWEITVAALYIALYVAIVIVGFVSTGLGTYLLIRLLEGRWQGRDWLMALVVPPGFFLLFIGGWVFLDVILIGAWVARRVRRIGILTPRFQ